MHSFETDSLTVRQGVNCKVRSPTVAAVAFVPPVRSVGADVIDLDPQTGRRCFPETRQHSACPHNPPTITALPGVTIAYFRRMESLKTFCRR